MVNKLYADREFHITELTAIKNRLGDTTALEKERRILDEQLGIDAKAVNDLIARNARVAQNQKEYNERLGRAGGQHVCSQQGPDRLPADLRDGD